MKKNGVYLAIEVANDDLQGFSKDEIAERNGISQTDVETVFARPDYKRILDECIKQMLKTVTNVRTRQALNREWTEAKDG